jgi:hypothetical protein
MPSPYCVSVIPHIHPLTFECLNQSLLNLVCTYIMTLQPILAEYFLNSSHQSVSVCVYPS